jgi:adenine-specific DNA-methyltransferase
MEQLKKESDGSSLNIVESNIEQLKALFPEIVSEGKIDFEKLRETLGDAVETQEERYNFSWNGKALAKRIAQTKSTGTLKPCKAESKDWDSTQNLFIEGDNLEVLKLLQKSYHKQVKMIYIDPPYNTGNEFIYPDNFQDNLDTYLQYTHQKDDEGRKFGTNPDTSGRYHTNWLNMMYPRLRLAKNLLRDDGVIFISIDDNEVANLRKLCDEVFGEENFISNIIWRKKYGIQNDAKYFSVSHEYLVCITKNKLSFAPNLLERSEEQDNRYKNQDNDLRGPWKAENASVGRVTQKDMYEIITPSGRKVTPPEGRSWVVSKDKFQELLLDNRIWFGETGNNVPSIKKFLSEVRQGLTPTTFWDYDEVGHTDGSNKALKKLFDNSQYFDYPKPVDLIKRAIKLGSDDHGLVLDFFSGSATTAHSVMQLNVEDGGNRRFIMVQLPEPCTEKTEAYKAGYKTIADIGKERIRRAGEKILQDNAGIDNLDIGFKVFKLDSSNIKPWDADFDNLENTLLNIVDNIKEDRSEDDVLTEILLKYGLDLTVPVEERQVSGKTVYVIGFGALVVCLADAITLEVVEGIGHLKAELAPEVMRVVFKDSGFKDDVVKTNAIQILKQYGIDDVKSL